MLICIIQFICESACIYVFTYIPICFVFLHECCLASKTAYDIYPLGISSSSKHDYTSVYGEGNKNLTLIRWSRERKKEVFYLIIKAYEGESIHNGVRHCRGCLFLNSAFSLACCQNCSASLLCVEQWKQGVYSSCGMK